MHLVLKNWLGGVSDLVAYASAWENRHGRGVYCYLCRNVVYDGNFLQQKKTRAKGFCKNPRALVDCNLNLRDDRGPELSWRRLLDSRRRR